MFCGCWGISIHPLYTEKDLYFDPALAGNWMGSDQDMIFIFKASENRKAAENIDYELNLTEVKTGKTLPGGFEAHLFRLNEHVFLDLYPEEPESDNAFYNGHLIPLHSFWKVYLKGDTLGLAAFDVKWLGEMIEQNKIDLKYEVSRSGGKIMGEHDQIVLTSSTEELQTFILNHLEMAFPASQMPFKDEENCMWFYRQN